MPSESIQTIRSSDMQEQPPYDEISSLLADSGVTYGSSFPEIDNRATVEFPDNVAMHYPWTEYVSMNPFQASTPKPGRGLVMLYFSRSPDASGEGLITAVDSGNMERARHPISFLAFVRNLRQRPYQRCVILANSIAPQNGQLLECRLSAHFPDIDIHRLDYNGPAAPRGVVFDPFTARLQVMDRDYNLAHNLQPGYQ
ncbi:hypothetical protein GF351_01650 [Candidatus Woesearchaeota archaeon]|nr:hypothetical protein [Candidatus Woesearchaeota archaeon]